MGLDRYGDELPPGAKSRLGCTRWHGEGPDLMAFFSEDVLITAAGSTLRWWDMKSFREIQSLKSSTTISSLALSSDLRRLAFGCWDGEIVISDVWGKNQFHWKYTPEEKASKKRKKNPASYVLAPKQAVLAIASCNESEVLTGHKNGLLCRWNVATGEMTGFVKAKQKHWSIDHIEIVPQCRLACLAVSDQGLFVIDTETGDIQWSHQTADWIDAIAVSPSRIAVGFRRGDDSVVRFWDVNGGLQHEWVTKGVTLQALAFSIDQQHIALGFNEKSIVVREVDTGADTHCCAEPGVRACMAFSPSGGQLAVAHANSFSYWDLATGRNLVGYDGPDSISTMTVIPNSTQIVLAQANALVTWDYMTDKKTTFIATRARCRSLALFENGTSLAGNDYFKNAITVWRLTGTEQFVLKHENCTALAAPFHADVVISGSDDLSSTKSPSQLIAWDGAAGKKLASVASETIQDSAFCEWNVHCLDTSADGTMVVSAGTEEVEIQTPRSGPLVVTVLRLWKLPTLTLLGRLHTRRADPISAVAFSRDAKLLAAGDRKGTIWIWDIKSKKRLHSFQGHEGWVASVAFSPTGSRLATGGDDCIVRLWDVPDGTSVKEWRGHEGGILTVAFPAEPNVVLSAASDGTVIAWEY